MHGNSLAGEPYEGKEFCSWSHQQRDRSLGSSGIGVQRVCWGAARQGRETGIGLGLTFRETRKPAPRPVIHPPSFHHALKQQKGILRSLLISSQSPSPFSVYLPPSLASSFLFLPPAQGMSHSPSSSPHGHLFF